MNQKDRAIVKGKMDKLQAMYLEAWQKQVNNEKLKAMWETIADVSVSFDQVCARLDYYHQAALERDDQFWLTFEENARLKEQVSQLKEANQALQDRIEEMGREYEI
jgi:ubiquinone biosynthesis protein UbiJ